ncbi:solute carrier family 2, facilitated glucose transporter member 3-like [Corticium candelabrum]|uniref:solute carrier family 2, facilitated glucose transporter member 3-like n=1 Tax=Corticium candelabrum TaxID=121492 RepID=UPI002E2552C6|nr:solute carrier family 2, facilitated glucose transporter member 3-like [Corticium candelabrum]
MAVTLKMEERSSTTVARVNDTDESDNAPLHVPVSSDDKVTLLLVSSALSVVLGSSAQYGYQIGVLNSPMDLIIGIYENTTHSSQDSSDSSSSNGKHLYALAVAIFAIGGLIGAFISAKMADTLGRKPTMLLNNILAVAGSIIMALSSGFPMLIGGRFVIGINGGITTGLAPMYLTEISPIRVRGVYGLLNQLGITAFIFISQLLGLPKLLGNKHLWRLLFGFPLVLVTIQLLTLPFCPESPRYLYLCKHKQKEAADALRRLRGTTNVQRELNELQSELQKEESVSQVSYAQLFCDGGLRRPLLISFGLQFCQQLSGILGVFYYSTAIFKEAGLSLGSIATVITSFSLIPMTIIAVRLMERVGRRTLMLYGLGGMMIFHMCLTIAFCFQVGFNLDKSDGITVPGVLAVVSSVLLVSSFAIGPGGIPWMIVAELFTQGPRALAVSLSGIVNWLLNGLIGYTFPFILDHLYPYAMLLFAAICGVLWLFVYVYVPETKHKTVEETAEYFRSHTHASRNYSALREELTTN